MINAESLSLNRGLITAETGENGEEGANIGIQLRQFLNLDNQSLISSTANGEAGWWQH